MGVFLLLFLLFFVFCLANARWGLRNASGGSGQKLAHFPESLEANSVRRITKEGIFFFSYPIKMTHEDSRPRDGA